MSNEQESTWEDAYREADRNCRELLDQVHSLTEENERLKDGKSWRLAEAIAELETQLASERARAEDWSMRHANLVKFATEAEQRAARYEQGLRELHDAVLKEAGPPDDGTKSPEPWWTFWLIIDEALSPIDPPLAQEEAR